MLENNTPYLGKVILSFEKNPQPSETLPFNGVVLNLGFTKLVSRIKPDLVYGEVQVHPETIMKIEKETGLKVHSISAKDSQTGKLVRYQTFHPDGDHLGSIEIGWLYVKMRLKAIKGKSPLTAWSAETKQWIGFNNFNRTNKVCAFGKGDKLFDPTWIPTDEDLYQLESYWVKQHHKYVTEYENWQASTSPKKATEEEMSLNYWALQLIPYQLRGSKVIKSYEEAYDAAIAFSNYSLVECQ